MQHEAVAIAVAVPAPQIAGGDEVLIRLAGLLGWLSSSRERVYVYVWCGVSTTLWNTNSESPAQFIHFYSPNIVGGSILIEWSMV